jgi:hypothetical protein
MAAWCALLAERVRGQDEQCRLTLGQDDVITARGVRPATLAASVDVLGLLMTPQRLALPGHPLDPGRVVFVAELAQALTGDGRATAPELALAGADMDDAVAGDNAMRADPVTASPDTVRRACDQMVQRLVASGAVALGFAAWTDWGARLGGAPPSDLMPWLATQGILDSTGVSKPVAMVWESLVARDRTVAEAAPYPPTIDVDSYYANLPDSVRDLYASWQGDRGDVPAILG